MKGLLLASGIEPAVEDFNTSLSEFTQEAIKERLTDFIQDGIVHSETGGSLEYPLSPNILDQTKIDVGFGVSYSSGERILIASNVLYDPTNPSKTDISSGKPTPQSTGSIAISLANYTTGTANYFWIQYLQTIDITQFAIHPITSEKFFTRDTDGYWIIVDTTHHPVSNPLTNAVFLGTVLGQGAGNPIPPSNISLTNRQYALTKFNTVKVKTPKDDRSDAVTVYGGAELHTVDDHIKARGTALILTPVNPHGLTLADLGVVSSLEPLNELYAKETQNNKIETQDVATVLSALFPQVIVVDPGNDFININNLLNTESAYVNGIRKGSADVMAGINPVTITFLGQATNLYYGYLDNGGNVSITTDYVNIINSNHFLPLFAVSWLPFDPAGGGGNIRNPDNSASRSAKDLRPLAGENNTEVRHSDPLAIELFPGRRWLNISDGQVKTVKDTVGTIVIMA